MAAEYGDDPVFAELFGGSDDEEGAEAGRLNAAGDREQDEAEDVEGVELEDVRLEGRVTRVAHLATQCLNIGEGPDRFDAGPRDAHVRGMLQSE